jgi:hypothetical protein
VGVLPFFRKNGEEELSGGGSRSVADEMPGIGKTTVIRQVANPVK